MKRRIFILILFAMSVSNAGAVVVQQPAGTNIALGQKYTLSPAPNYSTKTNDNNPPSKLTDGTYTSGYFWDQKTTVGWMNKNPVCITFDLGSDQPISGLSFSTAAGMAGVTLPRGIAVLVSNDLDTNNKPLTWHYAGDLVDLDKKENGGPTPTPPSGSVTTSTPSTSNTPPNPPTYKYKTTLLKTHGQFVQLIIYSIPFTFVDEIEIYQGTSDLLTKDLPGPVIMDKDVSSTWYQNNYLFLNRLNYRLNQDWASVSAELNDPNSKLPSSVSGPLNSTLQTIKQQLPLTSISDCFDVSSFKTVFPENDPLTFQCNPDPNLPANISLHGQIFAVQAAIWRAQAQGFNGIVASPANRWEPLSPIGLLSAGNASVNVAMMSNEYRAGTFNLSNAGSNSAAVNIKIVGLPGGTDPSYISVFQVPFTDTEEGNPVAAALLSVPPLLSGGYSVSIPPGLTQQIWLSFNPKQVSPGIYNGVVQLSVNDAEVASVPVQLKIYPLSFPSVPTLHVGGWDYAAKSAVNFNGVTDKNRQAIMNLLPKYFVDTPWATWEVLGATISNGNMTETPDTSFFSAWHDAWPNARNYYVFLNAQPKFEGFNMDPSLGSTAAGSTAFTAWIQWWVKQLKQLGVNPDQLGFLLVDEPQSIDQDNIVITYANAIHARPQGFAKSPFLEPTVSVFEDPEWPNPSLVADPTLFGVSNILSQSVTFWISRGQPTPSQYEGFYVNQQNKGHELWFYNTLGPTSSYDPYAYYLAQEWLAAKYGAQGSEFWAFTDSESTSSWNEYTSSSIFGSYSPLFIDATSATPAKYIEALREGVEDYEYLRMLRDKIQTLQHAGVQVPSSLTSAASAPDTMLRDMTSTTWQLWSTAKKRTVADGLRVQILDALAQFNLTVTISGLGMVSGYYTDPTNLLINCGANETVCSSSVNSSVTLMATAAGGSTFSGWSVTGSPAQTTCTGITSPCTITLNADTTITANFTLTPSIISGVYGQCGTANTTYAYGTTNFGSDTLCAQGNPDPSTVAFPEAGHSVSWTCQGTDGGTDSSCSSAQKLKSRIIFRS